MVHSVYLSVLDIFCEISRPSAIILNFSLLINFHFYSYTQDYSFIILVAFMTSWLLAIAPLQFSNQYIIIPRYYRNYSRHGISKNNSVVILRH